YTLSLGAVTDPGTDTVSAYRVNWGDGSHTDFTGSPVGQTAAHTYADGPNACTISVDLTDEDGTFAVAGTRAVTVNNVAPTLTLSGASSVNEGSTYTLGLSASDPGADTINHWTITWGDGSSGIVVGNPPSAS